MPAQLYHDRQFHINGYFAVTSPVVSTTDPLSCMASTEPRELLQPPSAVTEHMAHCAALRNALPENWQKEAKVCAAS